MGLMEYSATALLNAVDDFLNLESSTDCRFLAKLVCSFCWFNFYFASDYIGFIYCDSPFSCS